MTLAFQNLVSVNSELQVNLGATTFFLQTKAKFYEIFTYLLLKHIRVFMPDGDPDDVMRKN